MPDMLVEILIGPVVLVLMYHPPAFNENNVHVKCVKSIVIEGQQKHNIFLCYGLKEAADSD